MRLLAPDLLIVDNVSVAPGTQRMRGVQQLSQMSRQVIAATHPREPVPWLPQAEVIDWTPTIIGHSTGLRSLRTHQFAVTDEEVDATRRAWELLSEAARPLPFSAATRPALHASLLRAAARSDDADAASTPTDTQASKVATGRRRDDKGCATTCGRPWTPSKASAQMRGFMRFRRSWTRHGEMSARASSWPTASMRSTTWRRTSYPSESSW